MSSSKLWWLRDHKSASGKREVREDYDRASDDLQAAFDAHWEYLEVRPRDQWVRPAAHKLRPEGKNGYREFFEFRFKAENTQQRPLGFFGPSSKQFTLLIWAIEKGSKFSPLGAVSTCESRRNSILGESASSVPWNQDEQDEDDKTIQAEAEVLPRRIR